MNSLPDNVQIIDMPSLFRGIHIMLPSNAFNRFTHVRELICTDLEWTSLPTLPPTLKKLYCFNNRLTLLPELPSTLTHLYCHHNALTLLPTLPNTLRELYCSNNLLSTLPELPNTLSELSCSDNRLSLLPELPSTLTVVYCSNNQLPSLPALPAALEKLDCSENPLTLLPELPNALENLHCSKNRLTSLPISLTSTSIVDLNCDQNQLTSLPLLPSTLIEFDCHQNQLTTLPMLPNALKKLNCSENLLTSLPPLPRTLVKLQCSFNRLILLPELPPRLRTLLCDHNQLSSFPPLPATLRQVNTNDQAISASETARIQREMTRIRRERAVPNLHFDQHTPLEPSNAVVHLDTDMGTDYISGEEMTAQNYVREDANNVVFYFNGQILCFSNRKDIQDSILPNDSNIKFGCHEIQRYIVPQRSNVILDVPYVAMRSLGCMVGLVPLAQINELVANEAIHYVEIVPTNTRLVTTASLQMLGENPNAVGASHCQGGQEELVYQLKTIQEPTVGGKHKRRNKTKHRKIGSKFGCKCKTRKHRKSRKGRFELRKGRFESRKHRKSRKK